MRTALRLLLLLLMGGALVAARWANGRNQLRPQPLRAPVPSAFRRPARLPGRGAWRPLAPGGRFAEMRAW